MPAYLSQELAGSTTANQTAAAVGYRPRASAYQANTRRLRGTFTLGTQTTSDTLEIGNLPAGATFAFGVLTSSVSLGSSTVAIGTVGATGKYRAGAVFTAVDTPTMFGIATQVGAVDPALAAEERVFVTIGAASLPASGTFVVDLYFSDGT
ncbi:MAG: hypothetical protein RI988_730 [Pseudomonadota bacterium]|jgi:hypothetical protein